ncbi:MAG: glycosyltransferase family 39 protein [Candidatus Binataceae bacterium]|nr:glycosyltransferase family 39 protein [Candidatus Binataceae bacterium]
MKSIVSGAALAAIFALLFLSQGITAPFQKDEEARPAGIVADIVQHGDWLIPADLYGEATRKPPLFYWLSAIMAQVRGGPIDEAGARMISLIAAAALTAIVAAFAATYLGISIGWLAALFLLGIYGFASRGPHVRTDMLFSCLLFASYCTIYPQLEGSDSISRSLFAGFLLGLALLTKGPLAIAICGLALTIFLMMTRRNPLHSLIIRRWAWIVLVVACATVALWYVPAFMRDPQLLKVQFGQENLGHLVPSSLGGTGEAARPFYYLWIRLIGGSFPLILYLPAAIATLWRSRDIQRPVLYQSAMVLAVLAIFTIASSKRDIYVLPAFAPLAIVLAAPFASLRDIRVRAMAGVASAAAAIGMLVVAIAGLAVMIRPAVASRLISSLQSSDAAYMQLYLNDFGLAHVEFIAIMSLIAISSIAGLALVMNHRTFASAIGVGIASLAAVSLWIGLLKPELAREHTLKGFAASAQSVVENEHLYVVGAPDYELSYYLDHGVPGWRPRYMRNSGPGHPSYVMVWSNQLHRAGLATYAAHPILESAPMSHHRRMLLLRIDQPSANPATAGIGR